MARTAKRRATKANDAALALVLFDRTFHGPSWSTWRAWVCGLFGLPMSNTEAAAFKAGRLAPPSQPSPREKSGPWPAAAAAKVV